MPLMLDNFLFSIYPAFHKIFGFWLQTPKFMPFDSDQKAKFAFRYNPRKYSFFKLSLFFEIYNLAIF